MHLGFNSAFIVGAGFVLLAALLVHLWIKEVPIDKKSDSGPTFKIIDRSLLSPGILSAGIATFLTAIGSLLLVHIPPPAVSEEGRRSKGSLWKEDPS